MPAQLHFGTGDSLTFGSDQTQGNGSSSSAYFDPASLTNLAVGDLLVAWIHCQSSGVGQSITAPTGWTHYGAAVGVPTSGVSRLSGLYYRVIQTSGDITSLTGNTTWAFDAINNRVACVVARATGIDLDTPEDSASTAFSSSSNSTSHVIPGIITSHATSLLVAGIHHQNAASTTSPTVQSLLTAFQEHKTAPSGSTVANTGAALGYKYLTSGGSTGDVVVSIDSTSGLLAGELAAFRASDVVVPPSVPVTTPTIVGSTTTFVSVSAVTSFTINKPAGYVDGDVMILALSAQSSTITSDFASAGWTRISQPFAASSAPYRLVAFYALPIPTATALTQPSFTFTSTDSVIGGRIAAEVMIVRGVDLSDMVTARSPYGTFSGQIVTVMPESSAVDNTLLLIAYGAQWTSGIDYTVASGPSGTTQQIYLITSTAAQSKTSLAVYQLNANAGAIAAKVLTMNGAFAQSSGASVSLRAIGAAPPNPGIAVKYTSALNTLSSGNLFYTSALNTISTPLEVRPVPTGYSSVTDMLAHAPFYIAHRGGSANWPEMSLHAYTQSVFWGVGALELSLARTSDGVWFGLHDSTLDRTSGTTGFTASAHTWAEVQNYLITASGVSNSSQGAKPYARWEEIMASYYSTHIFLIDPKAAISYTNELLNMMDAMPSSPTSRFIGKYYGVSGNSSNTTGWPRELADRGYHRWGYFYQSDSASIPTYQGRWDILGMEVSADQATWDAIKAYGKPVIGHIPSTLSAAQTALSKGADGLMCSGVQQIVPRSA